MSRRVLVVESAALALLESDVAKLAEAEAAEAVAKEREVYVLSVHDQPAAIHILPQPPKPYGKRARRQMRGGNP